MSNGVRACIYLEKGECHKGLFHCWINVMKKCVYTKKEELKKVALVENEYGFMICVPPNKIQFVDTQEQLKKIENCLKERINNV